MIQLIKKCAVLTVAFAAWNVLAPANEARAQYFHEHHNHPRYNEVRRFGLHGHEEGRAFVVYSVTPGSAAERAGLGAGDRITKIDGDRIYSMTQFCDEIREAYEDGDDVLELEFIRYGSRYVVYAPF